MTTTMKVKPKARRKRLTPHDRYAYVYIPCQPELMEHLKKSAAEYAAKNKLPKVNLALNCRRLLAIALGLDATTYLEHEK